MKSLKRSLHRNLSRIYEKNEDWHVCLGLPPWASSLLRVFVFQISVFPFFGKNWIVLVRIRVGKGDKYMTGRWVVLPDLFL